MMFEIPPAVEKYFADKPVKLISYDPAIPEVVYELIQALGSRVHFHCGHLLGVLS